MSDWSRHKNSGGLKTRGLAVPLRFQFGVALTGKDRELDT